MRRGAPEASALPGACAPSAPGNARPRRHPRQPLTTVVPSRDRWRAALTRRRHRFPHPDTSRSRRVTSNVGQSYPYTSETEADRAAKIASLTASREGLADTLKTETTPVDDHDRWW